MDTPQYQRAVTPTIDAKQGIASSNIIRTKLLNYQQVQHVQRGRATIRSTAGSSSSDANVTATNMNIQGKPVVAAAPTGVTPQQSSTSRSSSIDRSNELPHPLIPSLLSSSNNNSAASLLNSKYDIIPPSDEYGTSTDGIIFARYKRNTDSNNSSNNSNNSSSNALIVFRTSEERAKNPERLNLDRRHLDTCPIIEQETRLRLLNYQNNNFNIITNIDNLPNLIFLDLYNNKITTLDGQLSSVKGLRVLMAGKNRITSISNLLTLRKLDVLDLHSNDIKTIEKLDTLVDLRVLNLAGNKITIATNLSKLSSLTELNLRRNSITKLVDLDRLPVLQRLFLSHNMLSSFDDIKCIYSSTCMIELSLDNNPLSEKDAVQYRQQVIHSMSTLKYLDLKKITDDDRISYNASADIKTPTVTTTADITTATGAAAAAATTTATPSTVLQQPKQILLPVPQGKGLAVMASDDASVATTAASPKGWKAAVDTNIGGTLTSLARNGKISSQQSMFDIEIISPTEKALIAVGENWEWVQNRRLLSNVVEASLYHMKRNLIVSKFAVNMSWIPALKSIRLVHNEIETLKDLYSIIEVIGMHIEHFIIRENPVCSSCCLLRSYIIALLPNIKSYNDIDVNQRDRQTGKKDFHSIVRMHQKCVKIFKSRAMACRKGSANSATSSLPSTAGSVAGKQHQQQQLISSSTSVATNTSSSSSNNSHNNSVAQAAVELQISNVCDDILANVLNKRKAFASDFNCIVGTYLQSLIADTITYLKS